MYIYITGRSDSCRGKTSAMNRNHMTLPSSTCHYVKGRFHRWSSFNNTGPRVVQLEITQAGHWWPPWAAICQKCNKKCILVKLVSLYMANRKQKYPGRAEAVLTFNTVNHELDDCESSLTGSRGSKVLKKRRFRLIRAALLRMATNQKWQTCDNGRGRPNKPRAERINHIKLLSWKTKEDHKQFHLTR